MKMIRWLKPCWTGNLYNSLRHGFAVPAPSEREPFSLPHGGKWHRVSDDGGSLVQLQIALFDPAQLALDLAEENAQDCGQNKADEGHGSPVHGGDSSLGAGGDIVHPAGVHADLAHQTAGAHAGGNGGTVHLKVEQAGGQRAGDGRGQRGGDPDAGVLDDIAHLEHTGAQTLADQAAHTVLLIAHHGKADHLGAAARHGGTAGQTGQTQCRTDGGGGDGQRQRHAHGDGYHNAHEKGLKVWGLVDNFTQDISTYEVLSRTSSRQNLISQLVNAAVGAGIDGINVDFEQLSEDVGVHFLEFLRELSIECHKNNLVLSVDNPVPEDFTSHYDRAEQGKVVDYVIIMGYDEHYVGSEEAGSVASLPWVEKGIQDTIAEVPAQRVINAVPFYTRLWKTEAGSLSSEAIGMDTAQEVVNTNNAQVYWDSDVSQNYGSFEKDGCTYQIWIEDSQSIAAKVQLVQKYNLAGVAAWKLGFENSSIWQVITDNLSASN